jgi:hypothetical protein
VILQVLNHYSKKIRLLNRGHLLINERRLIAQNKSNLLLKVFCMNIYNYNYFQSTQTKITETYVKNVKLEET